MMANSPQPDKTPELTKVLDKYFPAKKLNDNGALEFKLPSGISLISAIVEVINVVEQYPEVRFLLGDIATLKEKLPVILKSYNEDSNLDAGSPDDTERVFHCRPAYGVNTRLVKQLEDHLELVNFQRAPVTVTVFAGILAMLACRDKINFIVAQTEDPVGNVVIDPNNGIKILSDIADNIIDERTDSVYKVRKEPAYSDDWSGDRHGC